MYVNVKWENLPVSQVVLIKNHSLPAFVSFSLRDFPIFFVNTNTHNVQFHRTVRMVYTMCTCSLHLQFHAAYVWAGIMISRQSSAT